MSGPSNVVAILFHSLSLTISITTSSPPVTPNDIRWSFTNSSSSVDLLSNSSEHYHLSPDLLTLTISNVSFTDEGKYQVMVSTTAGADSTEITVNVESM